MKLTRKKDKRPTKRNDIDDYFFINEENFNN